VRRGLEPENRLDRRFSCLWPSEFAATTLSYAHFRPSIVTKLLWQPRGHARRD